MEKLTKRADGRYCERVKDPNTGKLISCYGKTEREAHKKAVDTRMMLKSGIDTSAQKDTFKSWADKWLNASELQVCNNEYKNRIGRINRLKPLWNCQIKGIRSQDVEDILMSLAKFNPYTSRPTSQSTIKKLKAAAYNVFEIALENHVITENPVKQSKNHNSAIGTPPEPRRALTDEEQQWIIDTPHRAQRAAITMMYSGLRRGELTPLTWDDIDFSERTISVNKFVEYDGSTPCLKSYGKSSSAKRIVNVPKDLVKFLKAERKKDIDTGNLKVLVCPDTRGKMLTKQGWRSMWYSYLLLLNVKYGHSVLSDGSKVTSVFTHEKVKMTIPNITPHWMRHTFATLLYLSGVDVLTAKEQLGHSDIKTTLDIYTHLDAKYKKKNIRKLDEYLSKKDSE
ncbi:MAG: site-specific integrase [Ruminococcaceae bacterium]|nr:site-specific integrase [Oscillospiraceae bacterium]